MSTQKEHWEKIQEFQNANKGFLIIVASPEDDSISVSYGGLFGFTRYPPGKKEDGVIFSALRASKFKAAIDPLIAGVVESMGMNPHDLGANELLKNVGGSIKSIGETRQRLSREKLAEVNSNDNKNHGKKASK